MVAQAVSPANILFEDFCHRLLVPSCKSSRNHSLTVVARKLLLSRARKQAVPNANSCKLVPGHKTAEGLWRRHVACRVETPQKPPRKLLETKDRPRRDFWRQRRSREGPSAAHLDLCPVTQGKCAPMSRVAADTNVCATRDRVFCDPVGPGALGWGKGARVLSYRQILLAKRRTDFRRAFMPGSTRA